MPAQFNIFQSTAEVSDQMKMLTLALLGLRFSPKRRTACTLKNLFVHFVQLIISVLLRDGQKEAKDVGKEKQIDAEPCRAQIRPIAVESPQ